MDSIFDGKVVMVTGGTGSIGSEIVRQLLKKPVSKVIVYSIDEIENYLLTQAIRDQRLEVILGDIRDAQHLRSIFTRFDVDYIYHAAALKHVIMCEKSPIEPVKTNILGTQNLIDLAIETNIEKFFFISTDKAVHPTNVMGASKFIAERLILNANDYAKKGQTFGCIRFGNVANSRGSVVPVFVENALKGNPITVTDRQVTRFTMKIDDAVGLILQATKELHGGEIFLLKMKAFSLGNMVDAFTKAMNEYKIAPVIKEVGLFPGEKLHEELANSIELMNMYELGNMYVILSPGVKARSELKKINLDSYSSNNVEMMTINELKELVLECIKNKHMYQID